jgi:hypothetical protein
VRTRVDAAGGQDEPLARDGLRVGAHDEVRVDPVLRVGVARLADPVDHPVLDPHVRLVDARVVQDERVGDDRVERSLRAHAHLMGGEYCVIHGVVE